MRCCRNLPIVKNFWLYFKGAWKRSDLLFYSIGIHQFILCVSMKCELPIRSSVILQVFTLWDNIEHWGNTFWKLELRLMCQSRSCLIVHFSQISPHWWGFAGRREVFVPINLVFRTGVDHLWSSVHLSLSNILTYEETALIGFAFYHPLKSAKKIHSNSNCSCLYLFNCSTDHQL